MTGCVKTKILVDAMHTSRKQLLERAKKEGWPCVQKGNSLMWIEKRLPMDVRFALVNRDQRDIEPAKNGTENVAGTAFVQASEKGRQVAVWRSSLIYSWKNSGLRKQDYLESYNACEIDQSIYAKLGPVSVPTFYRWVKEFTTCGASGIVPKYGVASGGAGESLTEAEKRLLAHFWLNNTQPSVMHALRLMKANVPYSACTYQTANRYLKSLPPALADFYRLGKGRFENMHLPYMEQDIFKYRSLDCVVSDHHCVDCIVEYHGKLVRPWITTMQDYRSGKVVGWCPSVKPSSLSIIVAYYMCCINYGVPPTLLFDNGKDYHSKLLNGVKTFGTVFTPEGTTEEQEVEIQGVFGLIGSEVHFTRVYNGKSKGRQERYFRIIGEYLAKDMGSYVGSDTRSRPEDAQLMFRSINRQEQRHDIPTWEDFVEGAGNMIRAINETFECTGKGMDGKTRSKVFEENLPAPGKIKHVTKEELVKALSYGETRRCGRNGVKINGTNYWAPELVAYSGSDVVVNSSLISDEEVTVYTLKGQFIAHAKGDYFAEGDDFKASIKKLESARKLEFQTMAELGRDEVELDPALKTMLDVNQHIYGQNRSTTIDELIGLPKAAGAEQEEPVAPKHTKIKGLLQADMNDLIQGE